VATAKDYGTADDRTLVPGTLTVFRHFTADLSTNHLYPMNYNPMRAQNSMHFPVPVTDKAYSPLGNVDGYRAYCGHQDPWNSNSPFGYSDDTHAAPDVGCSCGFYAHYDPDTDFYPGSWWGEGLADYMSSLAYTDLVLVRAVCEVSGTVVMGRLGVRAEKLKIKALAVDWGKYRAPATVTYINAGIFGPTGRSLRADIYDDLRDLQNEREHQERIRRQVSCIASSYDARYYGAAHEMYDDHPRQDVSSLIPETAAPKPAIRTEIQIDWRALAKALEAAGTSATQAAEEVRNLSIKNPRDDYIQAILDKKRSKPAPPGTGIDRRKRKI
jgi:hypothetical protein